MSSLRSKKIQRNVKTNTEIGVICPLVKKRQEFLLMTKTGIGNQGFFLESSKGIWNELLIE